MKKTKQHIHAGQKLKFYRPAKLYGAADGSYVETQKESKEIPIQCNPDGSKYIEIEDEDGFPTKYYLSWLVASTFLDKPKDGNPYIVVYKDGDPGNCSADNLEWGLGIENPAITDEVQLGVDMFVRKDGSVFVGNTRLSTTDHNFDSDVALWFCWGEPRLIYYPTGDCVPEFLDLNKIMENAGYVRCDIIDTEGNDAKEDKTQPRPFLKSDIIHIDGDVSNFASSNLLRVSTVDKRYIEYRKILKDYIHKRNIELNPGMELPDNW